MIRFRLVALVADCGCGKVQSLMFYHLIKAQTKGIPIFGIRFSSYGGLSQVNFRP